MANDFNIFDWVRSVTASAASTKARACALSMIQCADKNGITWVKRQTLAELTGCQERATQNHLQELEEIGLIERHGRVTKLIQPGCQNVHPYVENEHDNVESVHVQADEGVQALAHNTHVLTENVSKAAPITTHISTHLSTNTVAAARTAPAATGIQSSHDLPEIWVTNEAARFGIQLGHQQGSTVIVNALSVGMSLDESKEYITAKLAEMSATKYGPRVVVKALIEDARKWKAARAPDAKVSRAKYSHVEPDEVGQLPQRWQFMTDREFVEAHEKFLKACEARGINPKTMGSLDDRDAAIIEGVRNELR